MKKFSEILEKKMSSEDILDNIEYYWNGKRVVPDPAFRKAAQKLTKAIKNSKKESFTDKEFKKLIKKEKIEKMLGHDMDEIFGTLFSND